VLQGRVDVQQQVVKSTAGQGRTPSSLRVVDQVVSVTAGQKLVADPDALAPAHPVTLKMDQIQAIVAEAKVQDNTFKSAVAFDPAQPSPDGSGGNSTQKMITQAMAAAASDAAAGRGPMPGSGGGAGGFIGTFGAGQALTPPPVTLVPGGLKRVHVIITR
jgi:hypothetical protein